MPAIKISVVANCQAAPIAARLLALTEDLKLVKVPPVHTIPAKDRTKALELLSRADIIVHQPFGPGFGELASGNLRRMFPTKTFVSFPSIYFAGTIPQLKYLRLPEGGTLKGPLGDYHDIRLIRGYLDGRNASDVQKWLGEYQFDAKTHFDECVVESDKREKGLDVRILDAILDRIKSHRTMYTFNHPDNAILCITVDRIMAILGRKPMNSAPIPEAPQLGHMMAAIPSSVVQQLGLSYAAPDYLIDNESQGYSPLADGFFQVYRETSGFRDLIHFNEGRV